MDNIYTHAQGKECVVMKKRRKIIYPWVTFVLNQGHYCVSSKFVSSMLLHQSFQSLPDHTPGLLGVMELLGEIIPVFDMRTLLAMQTTQESIDAFEQVRFDFSGWMQALRDCADGGEAFSLPMDAPMVSLENWRKGFHTENHTLSFLMRKITEAYASLEALGKKIVELCKQGDTSAAKPLLAQADGLSRQISTMFDELVETYMDVSKGILIILQSEDKKLGIRVDEISGVMHFEQISDETPPDTFGESPYIKNIVTNNGVTYLQINVDNLLQLSHN